MFTEWKFIYMIFILFLNFDLDFNEAILTGTPLLFGVIAWFEFDWLYLIMLKQIFLDYKLYYLLKKIRLYGEVVFLLLFLNINVEINEIDFLLFD